MWGESRAEGEERRAIAAGICARCYSLADCRALLADLPPDTTGVWAGEVLDGGGAAERAA